MVEAEDNVILGIDFKGNAEARQWERHCDMPKGSYRGMHEGIPAFDVSDTCSFRAVDEADDDFPEGCA